MGYEGVHSFYVYKGGVSENLEVRPPFLPPSLPPSLSSFHHPLTHSTHTLPPLLPSLSVEENTQREIGIQ
jgi:hypothetical protein